MTELQLISFKEQARKFYKAILPLFNVWDDDNKTTLLRAEFINQLKIKL